MQQAEQKPATGVCVEMPSAGSLIQEVNRIVVFFVF